MGLKFVLVLCITFISYADSNCGIPRRTPDSPKKLKEEYLDMVIRRGGSLDEPYRRPFCTEEEQILWTFRGLLTKMPSGLRSKMLNARKKGLSWEPYEAQMTKKKVAPVSPKPERCGLIRRKQKPTKEVMEDYLDLVLQNGERLVRPHCRPFCIEEEQIMWSLRGKLETISSQLKSDILDARRNRRPWTKLLQSKIKPTRPPETDEVEDRRTKPNRQAAPYVISTTIRKTTTTNKPTIRTTTTTTRKPTTVTRKIVPTTTTPTITLRTTHSTTSTTTTPATTLRTTHSTTSTTTTPATTLRTTHSTTSTTKTVPTTTTPAITSMMTTTSTMIPKKISSVSKSRGEFEKSNADKNFTGITTALITPSMTIKTTMPTSPTTLSTTIKTTIPTIPSTTVKTTIPTIPSTTVKTTTPTSPTTPSTTTIFAMMNVTKENSTSSAITSRFKADNTFFTSSSTLPDMSSSSSTTSAPVMMTSTTEDSITTFIVVKRKSSSKKSGPGDDDTGVVRTVNVLPSSNTTSLSLSTITTSEPWILLTTISKTFDGIDNSTSTTKATNLTDISSTTEATTHMIDTSPTKSAITSLTDATSTTTEIASITNSPMTPLETTTDAAKTTLSTASTSFDPSREYDLEGNSVDFPMPSMKKKKIPRSRPKVKKTRRPSKHHRSKSSTLPPTEI